MLGAETMNVIALGVEMTAVQLGKVAATVDVVVLVANRLDFS